MYSSVCDVVTCRHLKRRHGQLYDEYNRQQRNGNSKDDKQTSISALAVSETKYKSIHPHQKLLVNSLVSNLIIKCGLPVSIVDSHDFRQFISDLDPKFVFPCRQTITNTILPTMRRTQQEKLHSFLQSCEHVALTADIWTDRRAHAFLGITVHSFQAGDAASHLLAFQSLHGSHTGQKIADAMEAVIADSALKSEWVSEWVVS